MTINRNYLTKLLLLFLLVISFSCEKESIVSQEVTNELIVKTIGSKELEKNDLVFQRVSEHFNNGVSKASGNSFLISNENIKYMEKGAYHSYTFSVLEEESSHTLKNLVFSLNKDGLYDSYMYTYNLTKKDREDLYFGNEFSTENKVSIQELDLDLNSVYQQKNDCLPYILNYTICYTVVSCDYGGEDHPWGPNCTGNEGTMEVCIPVTETFQPADGCSSSGGGNNDTGNPDGNNGGVGTGGTGTTDNNEPNSVITTPVNDISTFALRSHLNIEFGTPAALYLDTHPEEEAELASLLAKEQYSEAGIKATDLTLRALRTNNLEKHSDDFLTSINSFYETDTTDPFFQMRFSMRCAALKAIHPEWSDARVYWEASKDLIHLGLDIAGIVPFFGEAADLVNGGIYFLEGDNINGSLSLASAIPFVGWVSTGAKGVVKVVTTEGGEQGLKIIAEGAEEIAKLAEKLKKFSDEIDGVIDLLSGIGRSVKEGTGEYVKVKGHHPLAKKAFEGESAYDFRAAFSVSVNTLKKVWKEANPLADLINVHAKITGKQNSLYSAWKKANPNSTMTIADVANIEIQAMVDIGIPQDIARFWVIEALKDLKEQGVSIIVNIPWNGINLN
ncbi:hypothetical protein [Aquimarina sp. 2201CG14-23]|uniref:hypothetical protein n=1 Tax=Aquimarina mycalae TaxID=3040073 RepID=UPI002478170A|nr:hypothetical protein [Aquimarina sp. 2201CG14-23]MDH7444522.1 hypothetical protein [Aquimarina sp. 2201CG14-23]